MDRLNFNHLFYFYAVAKDGSIKDAAEKLHVSQPTISDQIKLLEEHFKCPLFERRNRGLYLTKEGETALSYAERIFGLAQEATARLRHHIGPPKASVDLGITHYMSQYFLYESILPFFQQQEVAVNIIEGERHHLLADLKEGNIDVVFTDNKDGVPSGMLSYRMGMNRTFAVSHKKLKKNRTPFPQKLNDIPFFNYTHHTMLKYEIDLFFAKNELAPKIIGEADDIDLLQLITEQGLAFTIVPEAAKNRFCRHPDVIVLGEIEEFQTSTWTIVRKEVPKKIQTLLIEKNN